MEQKTDSFATDTSKRTLKDWLCGTLVLVIGLMIANLGVTLFVKSELGADTFTLFAQGLHIRFFEQLGISLGTVHIGICLLLMVTMALTTKGYVKPGTIVCVFCSGWFIDLFSWILGDTITASGIYVQYGAMIAGCVILSLGMSVVIRSNTGTGPNDLVAIILSDLINKKKQVIAFRWVRIACDLTFVAIGFLLGAKPGAGTLATMFLTGPLVQFFLRICGKVIQKVFPNI